MVSFNDLPKDVLWIVLQHVIIHVSEKYLRLTLLASEWEHFLFTTQMFPDRFITTAHRMRDISLISKRVRMLLKSKCQWEKGSPGGPMSNRWGFIKGSIADTILAYYPWLKAPD
jgi:hypothetical protein